MALFEYRAKSKSGDTIVGKYDVESYEKLRQILHEKDLLVMKVKERKVHSVKSFLFHKKINNKDMVIFCRQFHTT